MNKLISAVSPAVVVAIVLTMTAIVLAVIGGVHSVKSALSPLEAAYSHGIALLLGIAGSFWGGSLSSRKAAKEIVRPTARSGFRRVRSIYVGLSRIAKDIETLDLENGGAQNTNLMAIGRIQSTVEAFLATADDAMEEWSDIVPEEVQELYRDVKSGRDEIPPVAEGDNP